MIILIKKISYIFLLNIIIQMKETVSFFRNVIFCEMQSCNFGVWEISIHEIWIVRNTKQIQDLMKKFERRQITR